MWICRAGGGSLPLREAPRGLPGPAPPALDLTPRLLAWLLGSEPEALRAQCPSPLVAPCAGTRPVLVVAARPRMRMRTPTVTVPQGDRPVVRGQRRLGGEAPALAAPESAPLQRPLRPPQGLVPEGPGVPQPGGAFLPGRRVPEARQDAQGQLHRGGRGGGARPCPEASRLCSRPPSLPPSLPDCGSTGPRPGIPSPGRGGPAPRPAPTADPRRPVPHLLHQRPLGLLPPASPQEGVCGPHELSSGCSPPQGEGPPSPTPNPQSSP